MELHSVLTDFLLTRVDLLYRNWGSELTVTSGSETDARHGKTSLHYATPSQAVDTRTWEVGKIPSAATQYTDIKAEAVAYCQSKDIPTDWIDVILESDHIHIEYQPKRQD